MRMKHFYPSDMEIEIVYRSNYSRGSIIMDLNFYKENSKRIEKLLKGCSITLMATRKKQHEI